MAERCVGQRKRLAQGEEPRKYAKGGMVFPRKSKQEDCGCAGKKCDGGVVKKGVKR